MKKMIFTLVVMIVCFSLAAQTNLYENPDFDKIAKTHELIAIIPFKTTVTLRPRQMKKITPKQLERMEKAEGKGIQSAMFSWFMKREKRGTLTVKVQSPMITNGKLKKKGITYDNFEDYTPMELAEILGVDAIIMGSLKTNKPMSEGASIAVGVIAGFYGSTNKAVMNLFIYNAKDGEVLVNYNKGISGSIGSSTEDLVNVLMRKASRRIAYTKKR